jgi:uncharacterized surface protein with fasciclin (FAS1) repeats
MLHVLLALLSVTVHAQHNSTSGKTIVDLAVATPDLSTLVTALKAGGLVDTLSGPGPFTVFAPTNEAFAALPSSTLTNLLKPANKAQLVGVLTYHVVAGAVHAAAILDDEKLKTVEGASVTARVSGSDVFINSAKVTTADVDASNGVVHIIDGVLLPPPSPTPAPQSIVDLAVGNPDLSTLVAALKAADLVDTLSGPGAFTVFAPTNEAFAKLPAGVVDNLLKPGNKAQLVALLTYHVVPKKGSSAAGAGDGPYLTNKLIKGTPGIGFTTVEGGLLQFLRVSTGGGRSKVKVNPTGEPEPYAFEAGLVAADLIATNGVVQVIDHVLTVPAAPTPAPPAPTPAPSGNHLFFRGIDQQQFGNLFCRCGDVDAAPRMPPALFEPQNALFLKAYEEATILLYNTSTSGFPSSPGKLAVGRCKDIGYTQAAGGNQGISWFAGFGPFCEKQCGCSISAFGPLPYCKDVPDDPKAGKFCSLCGPKYNGVITINLWTLPTDDDDATECPGQPKSK